MIALVREACVAGAGLEAACAVVGISPRTLQRWQEGGAVKVDGRQAAAGKRTPANQLSPSERQRILEAAHRPEFAGLPPSQIVGKQGTDHCFLWALN